MSRAEAEVSKGRAERFARYALDDPDLSDDIASETLDEWAARKRITLVEKPRKEVRNMARARETREDLQARVEDLESENEDLASRVEEMESTLEEIAGLASGDESDSDSDPDEEE